ncbi:MAG: type II secretion system protein GspF [Desulfobacteraceae bacterium]|nr:MAG: type II secretion system protein GspF [Desulfobacteraceae bacterium]
MATYSYKATDPAGKLVTGTLEAAEEKEAVAALQRMRYIPIRISLAKRNRIGPDMDLAKSVASFFRRVSTKDVVAFTQDLSTLLEAGVPVDRALSILIDVAEKDIFKDVIRDVLKNIQGGSYLSNALAKYPRVFSSFYVSMIKAGEAGGVLDDVLKRLGVFLESSQDFKDYVKSAMVYPIFLVLVGGISIIVLLTFVMPKFSVIFSDMRQAIPLSTRILLGFSAALKTYWPVILVGLGVIYYLMIRYIKTPAGSLKMDHYKLHFPVVGELVKKIEVARFARTLGTLAESGVPILQALSLVKDIIGNQVIAGTLGNVYSRVKEGEKLSRPLGEIDIFPSLAIQMITVGEETGKLGEMLLRVAENYEKAARDTVRRLVSFLEPAMILCMGVVVGFIVISMMMAIFSINEMPF